MSTKQIFLKAKWASLIAISAPMIMWVFLLGHIPIIYENLNLSEQFELRFPFYILLNFFF